MRAVFGTGSVQKRQDAFSEFRETQTEFVEDIPFAARFLFATASVVVAHFFVSYLHVLRHSLDMASTDNGEIRATSYVGFDTITQQIEHKLLKRGFQFNVIVVGMYLVFSL